MKYAIKTRGTNSGNNPVGTIVYDLRGHESELQELRLLIDEYDPTNSDWNFRTASTSSPGNVSNFHRRSEMD